MTMIAARPNTPTFPLSGLVVRSRSADALLIGDTLAAIGFAGGLAGAIVHADSVATVAPWLMLAMVSAVVRASLALGFSARAADAGRRTISGVRMRVVRAAFGYRRGERPTPSELVGAALDETDMLGGYASRFLPARRAATIAPIVVLAAIAFASPVSAAILLGTLLPFVGAMILAGGAAAERSRRQFTALARLSSLFSNRVRALPIVLAFRAEEREAVRIGTASEELASRTMAVLRVAFLSSGALEFFAALSVALVAVYCGFALLGLLPFAALETLTLGEAFFALALAPEFYAPMRHLAEAYHERQSAETAAARLAPIVDRPAPLPPLMLHKAPSLAFDRVTIRYPDTDRPAIEAFSLTVGPGETVAIVGPSGSGKTSLLHALLGFAPVTGGAIQVDGAVLSTGESVEAAWAGQTPFLLPGTIAEAIGIAAPTASRERVVEAALAAGLGPALARRETGIDTVLDVRGGGLSGGERRRIGMARVLLKDAPLLLLDEPSAHLDALAEAEMIAVIARACVGRTAIIATHSYRLAAIADRVIRLGDRK